MYMISQSAQVWITQFYLQIHHACLSFVSVHQMAPPLTEVGDIHTHNFISPQMWYQKKTYVIMYKHKLNKLNK